MQVPVADRHVHRLHDVMRDRMQRGLHLRELVEHRQIVERRQAAHPLEILEIGRPGHRHEDRPPAPEGHGLGRVAGMERDLGGNGRDEVAHETAVEMHPLAAHIRARRAPVRQRAGSRNTTPTSSRIAIEAASIRATPSASSGSQSGRPRSSAGSMANRGALRRLCRAARPPARPRVFTGVSVVIAVLPVTGPGPSGRCRSATNEKIIIVYKYTSQIRGKRNRPQRRSRR